MGKQGRKSHAAGGGEASLSGREMEERLGARLETCFGTKIQSASKYRPGEIIFSNKNQLFKQFPYTTYRGIRGNADFYLRSKLKQNDIFIPDENGFTRVHLELKTQNTSGTADEKLPSVIESFRSSTETSNFILAVSGLWFCSHTCRKKDKKSGNYVVHKKSPGEIASVNGLMVWLRNIDLGDGKTYSLLEDGAVLTFTNRFRGLME